MKNIKIIAMTGLLCALLSTLALAKGKFHTIHFDQATLVNGTLVKKGDYQVKFDEGTNELTLSEGRHVIVTTTVKEEMLNKKAAATSFDIKTEDTGVVLTKVTFAGDRYALLLADNQAAER